MDAQILKKHGGISRRALIRLSLILILSGIIGKVFFENRLNSSSDFLVFGGIALLLKALSLASIPILLFLLSGEFEGIKNKKGAGAILLLTTLVLEIFYNLIESGNLIDNETRSPVAAFLLCFIIACLWEREKRFRIPLNIVIIVSALFWARVLSIEEGIPCILVFSSCFFFRKKEILRPFSMVLALGIVTLINPMYIIALPTPALLHLYRE